MSEEKQKEIDQFLEEVEVFREVTPQEAEDAVEANAGNILFIGRETCPYCRKFVRKLSPLAEEYGLDVLYLHSQHPEYEDGVQKLRDKYDVPTVPGLIYSSETAGLVVKCDSSLTPEEILDIIEVPAH